MVCSKNTEESLDECRQVQTSVYESLDKRRRVQTNVNESKKYIFDINGDFPRQMSFKDTHREKALSNEAATLTKSTNLDIWVVGTTNQLFIRGS